jgi:hypothetical protein
VLNIAVNFVDVNGNLITTNNGNVLQLTNDVPSNPTINQMIDFTSNPVRKLLITITSEPSVDSSIVTLSIQACIPSLEQKLTTGSSGIPSATTLFTPITVPGQSTPIITTVVPPQTTGSSPKPLQTTVSIPSLISTTVLSK